MEDWDRYFRNLVGGDIGEEENWRRSGIQIGERNG